MSSGSGTWKTLNLKGTFWPLHSWQAFAKLFGNDLKDRVNNEWKEYKEANPEANHSHQARFEFHNKKIQEWYDEADIEKKEVEEFQQKFKDNSSEGRDDPNRLFQE